jgi:hypothetical protein
VKNVGCLGWRDPAQDPILEQRSREAGRAEMVRRRDRILKDVRVVDDGVDLVAQARLNRWCIGGIAQDQLGLIGDLRGRYCPRKGERLQVVRQPIGVGGPGSESDEYRNGGNREGKRRSWQAGFPVRGRNQDSAGYNDELKPPSLSRSPCRSQFRGHACLEERSFYETISYQRYGEDDPWVPTVLDLGLPVGL